MKLLVSCIPFDSGRSGISVYVRHLTAELKKQADDLTLLIEPGMKEHFPGFNVIETPRWTAKPLFSMFYHLFILPFILLFKRYDALVIAAANRRTLAFYPLPTVAVVHDLAQYHVKCKYDWKRMIYLKTLLPFCVRRAHKIAAISKSTANDLIQYWKVKPGKIQVIYNGLSLTKDCAHSDWLKKQGLQSGKYILYISRLECPGKNHLNLISAFEKLPPELKDYHLVMIGADWDGAEQIHAAAESSPCADRIHLPGFVPSADMPDAYREAAGYVFPSFFEGFGLSLLEAMHYGIPCACSKGSSLEEVAGNAAILFDPASPDDMAAALTELLQNQDKRAALIAAGHERVKLFDWGKHAAAILECVKNL